MLNLDKAANFIGEGFLTGGEYSIRVPDIRSPVFTSLALQFTLTELNKEQCILSKLTYNGPGIFRLLVTPDNHFRVFIRNHVGLYGDVKSDNITFEINKINTIVILNHPTTNKHVILVNNVICNQPEYYEYNDGGSGNNPVNLGKDFNGDTSNIIFHDYTLLDPTRTTLMDATNYHNSGRGSDPVVIFGGGAVNIYKFTSKEYERGDGMFLSLYSSTAPPATVSRGLTVTMKDRVKYKFANVSKGIVLHKGHIQYRDSRNVKDYFYLNHQNRDLSGLQLTGKLQNHDGTNILVAPYGGAIDLSYNFIEGNSIIARNYVNVGFNNQYGAFSPMNWYNDTGNNMNNFYAPYSRFSSFNFDGSSIYNINYVDLTEVGLNQTYNTFADHTQVRIGDLRLDNNRNLTGLATFWPWQYRIIARNCGFNLPLPDNAIPEGVVEMRLDNNFIPGRLPILPDSLTLFVGFRYNDFTQFPITGNLNKAINVYLEGNDLSGRFIANNANDIRFHESYNPSTGYPNGTTGTMIMDLSNQQRGIDAWFMSGSKVSELILPTNPNYNFRGEFLMANNPLNHLIPIQLDRVLIRDCRIVSLSACHQNQVFPLGVSFKNIKEIDLSSNGMSTANINATVDYMLDYKTEFFGDYINQYKYLTFGDFSFVNNSSTDLREGVPNGELTNDGRATRFQELLVLSRDHNTAMSFNRGGFKGRTITPVYEILNGADHQHPGKIIARLAGVQPGRLPELGETVYIGATNNYNGAYTITTRTNTLIGEDYLQNPVRNGSSYDQYWVLQSQSGITYTGNAQGAVY